MLSYGFMFDPPGSRVVADAAAAFGFVNGATGKSVDDLPTDLPLFVVRAGRDQFAGVNSTIDDFAARALARNLPMIIGNHATGSHAFDMMDDDDTSRAFVPRMLAFFAAHLGDP